MARTIVTALDVGTSSIRLISAEIGRGGETPRILVTLEKETRALRHGYITGFDEATDAVRALLEEAQSKTGTRIRRVVLGMGGVTLASSLAEGSTAISRADAEVTDLDVRRAIDANGVVNTLVAPCGPFRARGEVAALRGGLILAALGVNSRLYGDHILRLAAG